jgi:hypothetical protein
VLARIERAGNQYRRAANLIRYANSSLERSPAEGHLDLSRQFLEIKFHQAEIELQVLALKESATSSVKNAAATVPVDIRCERIAEAVWRLSAERDEAKANFQKARENLKKAATPEVFRKAQSAMDLAQKEVMIDDKKLDLAGSNLEIQDYQGKRIASKSNQTISLADRIKLLKEELLNASIKPVAVAAQQTKRPEAPFTQPSQESRRGRLVANLQDYLERRSKLKRLRRVKREVLGLEDSLKSSLSEQMRGLEKLQLEHMELNQKTALTYNQASDLLRLSGKQDEVKGLLNQAEQQMILSIRIDEDKELTTRAICLMREQELLIQEDDGKIADWESITSKETLSILAYSVLPS